MGGREWEERVTQRREKAVRDKDRQREKEREEGRKKGERGERGEGGERGEKRGERERECSERDYSQTNLNP